MEITEVRIRLVNGGAERLRAFCSVTFDGDFVIRDLKIIEGTNGYFVAMPSRKLAAKCGSCGNKNHLRAHFCNECGAKLGERRAPRDQTGRAKLHVDVAHPINTACRERIQKAVVEAFRGELEKSKQPGYQPAVLDDADEFEGSQYDDLVAELKESVGRRDDRRGTRGDLPPPRTVEFDGDVDEPVERAEVEATGARGPRAGPRDAQGRPERPPRRDRPPGPGRPSDTYAPRRPASGGPRAEPARTSGDEEADSPLEQTAPVAARETPLPAPRHEAPPPPPPREPPASPPSTGGFADGIL